MILQISLDIAAGISYLHDNKIIHRDIQSKNIFLDENLIAKVGEIDLDIDFKSDNPIYRNQMQRPRPIRVIITIVIIMIIIGFEYLICIFD